MNSVVRVFLVCCIFCGDKLWAEAAQGEDNTGLSLLRSAVSSGIDPVKLMKTESLDANSLLLSAGKSNNPALNEVQKISDKSNISLQQSIQPTIQKGTDKSDSLGLSASTLSNNVTKIDEKDKYFGQHELCESEIIKAEKKYGIPNRLLLAISTVESGRAVGRSKKPWPWTICANGRGYYCTTKSAAIATTKRLMARGIRNIDVGCMQVNLLHHSDAFKNLDEAFTPIANVNYAAKFF